MRKRIIPFLLALVYTTAVFVVPVAAALSDSSPSERTYILRLQLILKDDRSELKLQDVPYSLYKVAAMKAAESSEHYVFTLEDNFLEAKEIFAPGVPDDPSDPGDPDDPSDPGDPGDPDDPSDPGDPGDPDDPGDPGDPTDRNMELRFLSDYNAQWLETMIKSLVGYVEENNLPFDMSGLTDSSGKLTFKDLDAGLYLLLGEPVTEGNTTYYPQAALVAVPFYYEEAGWLYNVRIKAKVAKEIKNPNRPSGHQIHVRKVWEGVADHPGSVYVELLRDGKPNRSATLSADNNWSYTWEGLDSAYQWTVRENPVPEGWQVSYTQNGNTFTITNMKTGPGGGGGPGGGPEGGDGNSEPGNPEPGNPGSGNPEPGNPGPDNPTPDNPPNEPGLPQTGQLWWPVPLLVAAGVPLLLIGAVLFGRKEGPEDPYE